VGQACGRKALEGLEFQFASPARRSIFNRSYDAVLRELS